MNIITMLKRTKRRKEGEERERSKGGKEEGNFKNMDFFV